jgi:hypothetical protein
MAGTLIVDKIQVDSGNTFQVLGNTGSVLLSANAAGITFAAGSAAAPSITTNNDTNTGIFFPAADTLAFAEGGTEVGRFDSSGNLQFNSGYGSAAVAYGCRAWVNFNGTGTVAIRASGNVSSITDSGVGFYTVNFTTAMPDVNYSTVATCQHQNGVTKQTAVSGESFSSSVSAVGLFTFVTGGSDFDPATVNVAVFR